MAARPSVWSPSWVISWQRRSRLRIDRPEASEDRLGVGNDRTHDVGGGQYIVHDLDSLAGGHHAFVEVTVLVSALDAHAGDRVLLRKRGDLVIAPLPLVGPSVAERAQRLAGIRPREGRVLARGVDDALLVGVVTV